MLSKLENTKVVIVYGSNDKVVRIEGDVARRLKKEFPTIRFVRMEGLGHDPFDVAIPLTFHIKSTSDPEFEKFERMFNRN